ncbi:sestrin-1 isoform X1 [Microplitis demolitor]|uniref:sestrin-1 isoform X1 n=2 Tax=Microplitis demolitor TaxID=69319 RepID=UPI0006D4E8C7|nr:sestrin-1 isoform X1 [Microplitis demolitor]
MQNADLNISIGSNDSNGSDDFEIVQKFLALCKVQNERLRDRNLAKAHIIVWEWLDMLASPDHWENSKEGRQQKCNPIKCKNQGNRNDTSVNSSKCADHQNYYNYHRKNRRRFLKSYKTENFFPESPTTHNPHPSFQEDIIKDSVDNLISKTADDSCLQSSSLDENKFDIQDLNSTNIKIKFNVTNKSDEMIFACSSIEALDDAEETTSRSVKIKGAKQKQLGTDDQDSDTKKYGKSPKFDDKLDNASFFNTSRENNLSLNIPKVTQLENAACKNWHIQDSYTEHNTNKKNNNDGIVFNTLEGFIPKSNTSTPCKNDNLWFLEQPGPSDKKCDEDYCTYSSSDKKFIHDRDMVIKNSKVTKKLECIPDQVAENDYSIDNEEYLQDEDMTIKDDKMLEKVEFTPGDVGRMLNIGNALEFPRSLTQSTDYLKLVTLHLPIILRLTVNCPFKNVRVKCMEILQMIKERELSIPIPTYNGPSAFIPSSEIPDISDLDERTHGYFVETFLQTTRVDHISRVMSSHPSYLDNFLKTQQFILRGDGPLPFVYRHLIAIMAAGRHQCSYLINLQKGEFLLQGGDAAWLQGLKYIPQKLQNLYDINKILAHRPWLLTKAHIEKMTKGTDSWSLSELVHAIVLLAHFHSLSSFVFSCGINEELDLVANCQGKENIQANSNNVSSAKENMVKSPKKISSSDSTTDKVHSPPPSPSIVGEQEVGVVTLMERMKYLSENSISTLPQEELSKRFKSVETQSAELEPAQERSSPPINSDIEPFVREPEYIYQDFAKRGQVNDIPTFRTQDYSWDVHGFSLVSRLYNEVGGLLDEKFKTAATLTYYTMGTHDKVDTSHFRRAIWNYIQCMFGIRHDDYDYNAVNQLLERSLKTFIKNAVCYPERVTKRDYDRVMKEFKHSEKVHVNLMILEARMQAELLYALRAIMQFMT